MNKILLFLLINAFLWAQTIDFKEEKHLSALNHSVIKKGSIQFEGDSIKIAYAQSDTILTYTPNRLVIQNKSDIQEINLNQHLDKEIYFLLLKDIFFDNQHTIETYFFIEQQPNKTILTPKNMLSNFIEKIEYKKSNKLEFLKLYFVNSDRIFIEQIN